MTEKLWRILSEDSVEVIITVVGSRYFYDSVKYLYVNSMTKLLGHESPSKREGAKKKN